ncbi:MAG: hypothetical protein O8C62_02390 [Candidatus Methanoperedens sp.]|nr:hypothetical protein [Candidatus Methanoperedens sp.]
MKHRATRIRVHGMKMVQPAAPGANEGAPVGMHLWGFAEGMDLF